MTEFVGRNLGPYRVEALLGIGGMSSVYKAYQPSMDRYVAIKVLPHHFMHDPSFANRFEQEARTIARLENARILPVYDYGEDQDVAYIVMRYLDGGTLGERLENGPLDADFMARVLTHVSEALDYAHSKGVIHRDIKPNNIMLDETGDAYLTDFGISRLVEGHADLTGSGIVGTPAYLSPEQGLGQPVDHRTDIYSLGVVLYQMATSDVPYQAETPMAVIIKHINDPLPLPTRLNPDLPPQIELVILKALAKDPEARYQSAGEMAAALRQGVSDFHAGVPPSRRPTDMPESTVQLKGVPKGSAIGSAETVAMAAGAAAVASQGQVTAPQLDAEDEQPQTRRKWLVPAIIGVILLCICGVIFLIIASSEDGGTQVADATATINVDLPSGSDDTTPDSDTRPTPTIEMGGVAIPEDTSCSSGQIPIQQFLPSEVAADEELPPYTSIFETPTGEIVLLAEPAAGDPVRVPVETLALNSVFRVWFSVPRQSASFGLFSRVSAEGTYVGMISTEGRAQILRDGESLAAAPLPDVADGELHLLEMRVMGNEIVMRVDGEVVTNAIDTFPPSAGAFAIEVVQGPLWVHAIEICSNSSDDYLFVEEFEGDSLHPSWMWLSDDSSVGQIEGGEFAMQVIPDTDVRIPATLRPELPPTLAVGFPAVEGIATIVSLRFTPTEHIEGAGLIVLSRLRQPLFALARMYCDPAVSDACEGDAIYFFSLGRVVNDRLELDPHVAGGGVLPTDEAVSLLLVNQGNQLSALYSVTPEIEDSWEIVGQWPVADARIPLVGLFTTASTEVTDNNIAYFDSFGIFRLPGSDLESGRQWGIDHHLSAEWIAYKTEANRHN